MIRWPVSSARAILKLFRAVQVIDVFVEDQGDEFFYQQLFQIALSAPESVKRVVGLGGREEVLKAARQYGDTRKAVFIIDGDLSWIRGDSAPAVPRVYRLDCYCIENLLLCQSSLEKLCSEEMICPKEEAALALEFDAWKKSIATLVDLFVLYAVLNQVDASVPTVGDGLARVLSSTPKGVPFLDERKVDSLKTQVRAMIVDRVGDEVAAQSIGRVALRVDALVNKLDVVSGKHFLLPLMHFRLKEVSRSKIAKEQARHRLARGCSREGLGQLARALDAAA